MKTTIAILIMLIAVFADVSQQTVEALKPVDCRVQHIHSKYAILSYGLVEHMDRTPSFKFVPAEGNRRMKASACDSKRCSCKDSNVECKCPANCLNRPSKNAE